MGAKMLVIPLGGFYPPVKIEQGLWDVLVGDRYPSTNGGAGTAGWYLALSSWKCLGKIIPREQ